MSKSQSSSHRVVAERLEPRRLLTAIADADLFSGAQSVHASSTDRNAAFTAANLFDGTNAAFLFDNVTVPQRLAVSNFNAAIHTLRFFDTPSYTERAAFSVSVYYSPVRQLSLAPASYTPLGTFTLPVTNVGGAPQGDVYQTATNPPDHPRPTDPFVNPADTVHFDEVTGLTIPHGTQSLLLDFGTNPAGFGFGFTEIQALGYASPARPADPTLLAWGQNVYNKINASLKVPGTSLYAESANTAGSRFGGDSGFAYVWPEATQFRVLNELVRIDPATYRPALRAFANDLHARYWRNGTGAAGGYRSGVSAGSGVFYDDNAHLAVSLAEAFNLTGERQYLDRAIATYDFVISGEDSAGGGGIYFQEGVRSTKDTISTLQAVRAALMLYQLTNQPRYLTDATRLYQWAATHTQQADGLFLESWALTGPNAGRAQGFTLINSAGIGTSASLALYDATGDVARLREAQRIARTSLGRYFNGAGAINDEGFWAFELVDAYGDLYLHDHNRVWLNTMTRAMTWLHANREDPNGHYGRLWARDAYTLDTVRPSWDLNDQAAVARSYLHTAAVQTVAPPFVTAPGDPVTGFYQGSVGGNTVRSSAGTGAGQTPVGESAVQAIDHDPATKYLNYGNGPSSLSSATKGVGTGFYVTPAFGPSIVTGVQVATGVDRPNRDPLTVSVEGTNATANLDAGSAWTLIADNVNLGINADPGRQTYGPVVHFANTTPYRSYRVIIKSQRGVESGVQYAEMNLVGAADATAGHAVAGRYVFYNNSAFGDAIATDKVALLPGQQSGFQNITSYVRGINGVMVDVAGASADFARAPSASDFLFEVPLDAGLTSWGPAPAPSAVTVRQGGGASGTDRVTITWPDGAIRDTWLRVTALSNARTNLARPDVFYFGNLRGETGDAPPGARATVNAFDLYGTRRALFSAVPIDSRYDFNRDGRVSAADLAAARSNLGRALPPFAPSIMSTTNLPAERRRDGVL